MTIHFHIPGQPVGKGRPRIGKVGAHARMFTPAKTVNYESTVALFAAQAMAGRALLTGPVNLQMRVDFEALCLVQDELGEGSWFLRYRSGPKKDQRFPLRDLPDGPIVRNEGLPNCSFFCEMAEQEYTA